jgi:hypothetical protein
MIRIRAIPGSDGWLESVIVQEVDPAWASPVPAGEHVLDEDPTIPLPVAYVDAQELKTTHDDRVAWRRFRRAGYDGSEAAAMARTRDIGGLPDAGVAVTAPAGRSGITATYPDVPGLVLRTMTGDDLDLAAPVAIESGLQLERCPGEPPCCRPPEAHAWLSLAARLDRADTLQMVLEHEGRPLQMELILVEGDTAVFSYTTHFTRERPHSFWREAERPVFEHLKARGVSRMFSRTRVDRPDWIQALKDNYGAVADGVWDERTVRLRFDPDVALSRCTGWPARRRVTSWVKTQGPYMVREVNESDPAEMDRIRAWLLDAWSDNPARGVMVARMLTEWVNLDRATLLICERGGTPQQLRAVRTRRGTVAGMAYLVPLPTGDVPAQRLMALGATEWQIAAGYEKTSTFASRRVWHTPHVQAQVALEAPVNRQMDRPQFREPFVEMEWDLAASLPSLQAAAGGQP